MFITMFTVLIGWINIACVFFGFQGKGIDRRLQCRVHLDAATISKERIREAFN
jgi:hypothetical protein